MFYIQPTKISAKGDDSYEVTFIRLSDGSSLEYTFSFSDSPRGICDYDEQFFLDTHDDPAETWFTRSLLSFDKARSLGVQLGADKCVPDSLRLGTVGSEQTTYLVTFGENVHSIVVTGDAREREATWPFGSCRTWLESGQFRFDDIDLASQPLLKAVLRLHEARNFETEVVSG